MRQETPRGLTVIFKGSNRCNAGCTFCSVGEAGGRAISLEDFETVAQQLEALVRHRQIPQVRFTFHGGEPTLLGADFLDKACERIARLPARVSFAMQSNLLAWSDELRDVCARHQIVVGSSLDPIAGDRRDGRGGDAFPGWLKSYLRVAGEGRAPGAIFVVTRAALGRAEKLLEVARSIAASTGHRFGLQINPVYAQGKALADGDLLVTPEEFGEFLVGIWKAWRKAPDEVRLTPVQDFSDYFFSGEGKLNLACSFTGPCAGRHVGIDFDLNVAGCGRRLDSRAFLGNLREKGLVEILDTAAEPAQLVRRTALLREGACAGCRFWDICTGGCPDDSALAGDLMARFPWCAGYRMLFEAMEAERRAQVAQGRMPGNAVRAVADLAELAGSEGAEGPRPAETWLLPTRDGRALRFEGGLADVLGRQPGQKRLFVHNARVRSLAMWEALLRRPDVSVVLFEAEGLDAALETLNGLGASIVLDGPAIAEAPAGGEALRKAAERFLFDPRWERPVQPFAQMLRGAVDGSTARPVNRYALVPGTFHLEVGASLDGSAAEPAAARILSALRREESFTPTDFVLDREPCRTCEHWAMCAGRLSPGEKRPCAPDLKEIVGRLAEVARDLRSKLHGQGS